MTPQDTHLTTQALPPAFDRGTLEHRLSRMGETGFRLTGQMQYDEGEIDYQIDVQACLREIDRQVRVIAALTAERDRYLEALRALSPAPVKKGKGK